jgi:hypothetical protein
MCAQRRQQPPQLNHNHRPDGVSAGPRLREYVQTIAHDCFIGQQAYEQVVHPIERDGQRASALRFDDRRVQALFSALAI